MKHDLTTGTWQDDTGCPISIVLAATSDDRSPVAPSKEAVWHARRDSIRRYHRRCRCRRHHPGPWHIMLWPLPPLSMRRHLSHCAAASIATPPPRRNHYRRSNACLIVPLLR